jgi:hypothetical protein
MFCVPPEQARLLVALDIAGDLVDVLAQPLCAPTSRRWIR